VAELVGEAVSVKNSSANAALVWARSMLTVAVGEILMMGISSGCESGSWRPTISTGMPKLIAAMTSIETSSRLPFKFIPEIFPFQPIIHFQALQR
jgi:hypothetical protein